MRAKNPRKPLTRRARAKTRRLKHRRAVPHLEKLENRLLLTVYYELDTIAQTDATLTGIAENVGINDAGELAFAGDTPTGDAVFVGDGPNSFRRVSGPPAATIFYNDVATINDAPVGNNEIAARDRNSTIGVGSAIRRYDISGENLFTNVALTTNGIFDAFLVDTDINDDGDVVFVGRNAATGQFEIHMRGVGLDQLVAAGFTAANVPRPQISNLRHVVYRTPGGSIAMFNPATGLPERIAGAPEGFTSVGERPGISKTGDIVTFYGELDQAGAAALGTNPGPGIFASISVGAAPRQIVRVAGFRFENNAAPGGNNDGICDPGEACIARPELGYTSTVTPISFGSFDADSRVGVIHHSVGAAGLDGDSFWITFIGTPTSASIDNSQLTDTPLLFSDQEGIWSVRLDSQRQLQAPMGRVFHPRTPIPVVQVNDFLGSSTITDLSIYDPIGRGTVTDQTTTREDHYIGFWANTDNGQQVVRASHFDSDEDGLLNHWEISGIDVDQDGAVDLDLSAMGANPFQKDLFVEIDWLYGNKPPVVSELVDNPDPVWRPDSLTLTALGVSDPDGMVSEVAFYRETDGVPGLNPAAGGDELVATDTNGSNGWSTTLATATLALGDHTYYAQATDDKGAVSKSGTDAPDTVNTVRDRTVITSDLVGIDFEEPTVELNSPSFWATVRSSEDTVNMTNFRDESGFVTEYDLKVATTVGSGITTKDGDADPGSLPQHVVSLDGLDDFFFQTGTPTWTLVLEDLQPQLDYEFYVFGLTDQATTQTINVIGEGAAVRFDQNLTPNWLVINSEQGDDERMLESYAEVVRSTQDGTITIMVFGSPTPALAGLAIRPARQDSSQSGTYLAVTRAGELVRITAPTGSVERLGFTGEEISGLAVLGDDRVVGLDATTDFFYELHTTTYDAVFVGDIGHDVAPGMAYDRDNNILYTMTTDAAGSFLVSINPASGAGSLIGSGNTGLQQIVSAAYDPDGQRVIVFDEFDNELYAIDPATGNASLLSTVTRPASLLGMEFDAAGLLATYNRDPGTFSNLLLRVDPDTGVAAPGLVMSEALRLNTLAVEPSPTTPPISVPVAGDANRPAISTALTANQYENDHIHEPAAGVTAAVVKMFADAPVTNPNGTQGITVHIDAGAGMDFLGDPFSQNIASGSFQGGDLIGQAGDPERHIDILYSGTPDAIADVAGVETRSYHEVKNEFFGNDSKRARELAFHYVVFADFHSYLAANGRSTRTAPFTSAVTSAAGDTLTIVENLPASAGALKVVSGTGAGQVRRYSASDPNNLTVSRPWTAVPDSTSTIVLFSTSSGLGELAALGPPDANSAPGNDVTIAFRGWGLNRVTDTSGSMYDILTNQFNQWRTLAHELGHNLSLIHCGDDPRANVCINDTDYHRSLMSYAHQTRVGSDVSSYADSVRVDEWSNLEMDFQNSEFYLGNSFLRGFLAGTEFEDVDEEINLVDYVALNNALPDSQAPSAVIGTLSPGDTINVGDDLTATVAVTDDAQVDRVEMRFDVDGDGETDDPGEMVIATMTGSDMYQATFAGIGGTDGSRTVNVRAFDNSGNVGLADQPVSVTTPVAGITVTPASGLITTEAGGMAMFNVVLDTVPAADVKIGISSADASEGSVSTTMLTFTPTNALTPQTVTVMGLDDSDEDGDRLYVIVTDPAESTDGDYSGMAPTDVTVTNEDNDVDTPGITVVPTSGLVTTEAGGMASFTVVLDTVPTGDVTIGISSSDTTEGTVSTNMLIFTTANALTPQTVTITGVDDADVDGDVLYMIETAAASSTDGDYGGLDAANVSVTNEDDDATPTPGITVVPTSGLVTTEAGATASFTVVLDTVPTNDVTIGISSSDTTEGTVSTDMLTFTTGNALTPQTVTVTGADDSDVDGDILYLIDTAPANSSDGDYNNLNAANVSVTNEDDDTTSAPGITVVPTSGLVTTEAGGTAFFTLVLHSVPTADVIIGVSSSDTTEGTVSSDMLTFTTANALTPQTVTVTGADDTDVDGDVLYLINIDPAASTDGAYDGLAVANVSVTNEDDDTVSAPGITVVPTSGLVTTEAGAAASFTVTLDTVPADSVSIGISSSDTTEGTVSTDMLIFTTANALTPQTVSITGMDDTDVDGDILFLIDTAPANSTDGDYNNLDAANVSVTNEDDDTQTAGSISGTKYLDENRNGVRDGTLITGGQPDVVFVIDRSGSTSSNFQGSSVGDLNGDGVADTILDAEIAGFTALNQQLIDQGFGTIADIAIVAFDSSGEILDMDPVAVGVQTSTKPTTDADANGILDVIDVLSTLNDQGGTDFDDALRTAADVFTTLGTIALNGNMIFMSDGESTVTQSEVDAVRALANNVRAFGVGSGASLTALQVIDPMAQIFTTADELLAAFSGLGGGAMVFSEDGLAGVTVYIDENDNGAFDTGEPSTVTLADDPATTDVDETGFYEFGDLAAGSYIVREVLPAGSTRTAPAGDGAHRITLAAGQDEQNRNFGNVVGNGSISGTKYLDENRNGVRDGTLITGGQPDVVFVIDRSGSTSSNFQGSSVGDLNGDGVADTILDAEIAGFTALNQQLIDQGFGAIADIAIVAFDSSGEILDMDPVAVGVQTSTKPTTDADANGILDVIDVLSTLNDQGGTDFDDALRTAADVFTTLGTIALNGNMIFMSDGESTVTQSEVDAVRALANNVRAFGVGSGASLTALQVIDPMAQIFTTTDELLAAFSGLGGGAMVFNEDGLAGVTVYIDENDNGAFDTGEPSTVTLADDPATTDVDETGFYEFGDLAAGSYIVREVLPAGSIRTAPDGDGAHRITLTAGQDEQNRNFGNVVGNGSISGTKYLDENRNGVRDGSLITGGQPDVVFVIDRSGSTSSSFQGSSVGDPNSDGVSDTILDAQIAGFAALNQQLIDQGVGSIADVAIVAFDSSGEILDMDPVAVGVQTSTKPTTDADNNGILDVIDVLNTLNDQGGTDFDDALQTTADVLTTLGTIPLNGNVIFMSDGESTVTQSEVDAVKALANNVRAFGVGSGASLTALQVIDPMAQIFTTTDELLAAFSGLGGGAMVFSEDGLAGVTVYIDENDNGTFDTGEPSTVTLADDPATTDVDETGFYEFGDLAAGSYIVREVLPAGSIRTAPAGDGAHRITLAAGQDEQNRNFGNVVATGTISGVVFLDENGDGIQDKSADPGIGGLTVFMDSNDNGMMDPGEPSTMTSEDDPATTDVDETGYYEFKELEAKTYVVRAVAPAGHDRSAPAGDDAYRIPLAAGQDEQDRDFGYVIEEAEEPPADGTISGTKFRDKNGNGERDRTGGCLEPGIAGVTIYLDLNNNGALDTGEPSTVTQTDDPATPSVDETGFYEFTDLVAGTYFVREILPSGRAQTAPGGDGAHEVTISAGESIDDIDFGNKKEPRVCYPKSQPWSRPYHEYRHSCGVHRHYVSASYAKSSACGSVYFQKYVHSSSHYGSRSMHNSYRSHCSKDTVAADRVFHGFGSSHRSGRDHQFDNSRGHYSRGHYNSGHYSRHNYSTRHAQVSSHAADRVFHSYGARHGSGHGGQNHSYATGSHEGGRRQIQRAGNRSKHFAQAGGSHKSYKSAHHSGGAYRGHSGGQRR